MAIRRTFQSEDTYTVTLLEKQEEPGERNGKRFSVTVARKRKGEWTSDVQRYRTFNEAMEDFTASIGDHLKLERDSGNGAGEND